jgi:hypothetical protein
MGKACLFIRKLEKVETKAKIVEQNYGCKYLRIRKGECVNKR